MGCFNEKGLFIGCRESVGISSQMAGYTDLYTHLFGNMKGLLQLATALLATVLLLAGCGRRREADGGPRDSKLQRTITGTWIFAGTNNTGVLTCRPDGSYTINWSNQLAAVGFRVDGQWNITNDALVTKITKLTYWNCTNNSTVGQEDHREILKLDGEKLVFSATGVWTRQK